MELRQLRYFASIAQHQSFTKASEKLHIAQPALSRQIIALEDELGVKLLLRTVRGVELTDAGRRLQEMADYILRYIGAIKPSLSDTSAGPFGTVVVGLPPSLSYLIAPTLIAEARAKYPGLTLKIIEGFSIFLAEWLELERIDIALLTDPGPVKSVEYRKLIEEDMVMVGTAKLMSGAGAAVPFRDIVHYPLAITNGFHRVLEPWFAAYRISPNYEVEMDSIPVLKEMVLRGLYCTVFPYSMVHKEVAEGRLVGVRLTDPPIRRQIVSGVNVRRPTSMSIHTVEELLIEQLLKLPQRLDGSLQAADES
ncbi:MULTISPECIES: LysR family transcriptional regulator [unclassified Chelatococcus]|uniref:LysR family transcriptional regulator n=1 Tax=unclassified Chelatococcus TaxID=2638111 RepID=UPI001BD117F7|nr:MULTISPECIES: LysR family transcriptional regulator [unclassified Chelatococcus]MBS7697462.1 LysR family transcriptional regulator [Chelatococcus sp. YT9]MBX3560026.1 LysR family transcriptional regulator [Chelatococcus sp.]